MNIKKHLIDILERIELAKRHFVDPEKYVPRIFKARMGKLPDLANPKTFNEKLCWMKLYYHNPLYTKLVDKYEVKDYVAEKIGKQYIIPTLAVWDKVKDIEWGKLPNQFVLKCTHDSGGLVICKDKSKLDVRAAKKKLKKCMKKNYYFDGFEWPYKNVKPRIIAETYMEDVKTQELRDYKFFCFDGEVKALFIATDRFKAGSEVKFDYFDADFHHLPFRQKHENADALPEKPLRFEEMKCLASTLSKGIPHARIDFYEVNGNVFLGEITFFHFAGWVKFEPEEWDYTFGSWITLPPKML